MPATDDAVLFFGLRRPALRAARRLGLDPLVVTDGAAGETGAGRWSHPFADGEGLDELVARVTTGRCVRAALPTTERAVVAAARVRETVGLPGLDLEVALRCTDKVRMKRAVRATGIRTADFVCDEDGVRADGLARRLGLPLVLKARASSGSRGTTIVRTPEEVPDVLRPGWMAESHVSGVEMSFESLLVDGEPVFENPTEYFRPGWANILPAAADPRTRRRVAEISRVAAAALGIDRGMTHLEVFLQPNGDVVFGEIAARPPGGHLMELIRRAYGFDPWEALLRIALGDAPRTRRRPRRTAGVWLLHPGPGVVRAVEGVERARAMPGVVDLPFRVAVGDTVAKREGVGQEIGHVTVEGSTRDEVAERLAAAHAAIRVEVEDARRDSLPR